MIGCYTIHGMTCYVAIGDRIMEEQDVDITPIVVIFLINVAPVSRLQGSPHY